MIKQISLSIVSILLMLTTSYSQNAAATRDTLPSFFGISYIPKLNWNVNFMNHETIGTPLKLNFDVSSMSVVEGNFAFSKIKLKMGLSAQMENNIIGQIYRWGGYLGYKGVFLRMQTSKMTGNYEWSGQTPDGYYTTNTFSNNYFNIDLIKLAKKKRRINGEWVVYPVESQMGFYWGIGYTKIGYPVQLNTLVNPGGLDEIEFGVPAYDTLYNVQSYNIGFGFDLLRQLCLTGGRYGLDPSKKANPFAMYASTQDKLGFGPGKVSDYGVAMAEALNPGKTVVTSDFLNVMIHYSLSLGFRYYFRTGPAAYIFAIGYDLEGAAMFPFSGTAETDEDLALDFIHVFYNHGVSLKFYLSFDKDWK